jgi:diguanylate cyclase (GGDEF)-like protein
LISLPLLLKFIRQSFNASSTLPTQLVLAVGISLSIAATGAIARVEQLRQKDRFDRKADSLGFVLQRNFDNAFRVTHAVAGFFSFSENVTPEKFTQFSEQALRDLPGVLRVGFAQYIPHHGRAKFEASLARRGAVYPFVWQGNYDRVSPLEAYIVTSYVAPENLALLGYNHTSSWQRKWAIDRAQNSSVMSATTQVELPESGVSVAEGFVVYQSIYNHNVSFHNATDATHFRGVVYSSFYVEDAIATAIKELNWYGVSFYLYDLDIDRLDSALSKGLDSLDERLSIAYDSTLDSILANSNRANGANGAKRAPLDLDALNRGCPYSQDWTACIRTLNLRGSEWSILILPAKPPILESVWTTFSIGLLLTFLLALYLGTVQKRALQTEQLVQALREARSDPLTGLANRRAFEQQLKAAISLVQGKSFGHTLCYMDLDRFKIVNDICGHEAGDHLLCQVSQLIRGQIRKTDTLARVGGDEFCLLLHHCTLAEAEQVAQNILNAISLFQFHWQEKTFQIGISIGLAKVISDGADESELMRQADKVCYEAKQNGRNCIVTFNPEQHQQQKRDGGMAWISWLNDGLADEFLQLYCQPTLALKSDSTHNYVEILLRLRDRPDISISLRDFIQDAERYQLMPRIDRWVLQTFLSHLSFFVQDTNLALDWEKNIYAINLSGLTLSDENFVDFCKQQLEKYQIPPQRICFEITESVAISNIHKTKILISELRDLGCTFALDDFGKGMSSFAYLRDLPIDYLKVDGSFILNLDGDHTTYNIVNAITQVGQVLGVRTVAEFVEDEALLDKLQQLGFDYAQGYGIAYPIHLGQHFEQTVA